MYSEYIQLSNLVNSFFADFSGLLRGRCWCPTGYRTRKGGAPQAARFSSPVSKPLVDPLAFGRPPLRRTLTGLSVPKQHSRLWHMPRGSSR